MQTMSTIKLIAAVIFSAAVFMLGVATLGVSNLIEYLNGVTLFSSIVMIIIFMPLWLPAFKGTWDGTTRLGVGILLAGSSWIVPRVWSTLWRFSEYPEWMINHWTVAIGPALATLSAAFLVTVPENVDGSVRYKSWMLLMAAIAAGALTAGFMLGVTLSGTISVSTSVSSPA